MKSSSIVAVLAVSTALFVSASVVSRAAAQGGGPMRLDGRPTSSAMPPELDGIRVDEQLDRQIPLDAVFRDHTGKTVRLGSLIDGRRPTILHFAYHTCPVLCGMVFNTAVRALVDTRWSVGDQFDVISLSIDPRDTPASAAEKRTSILAQYGRQSASTGWHFLVGNEANIRRVAEAAGFRYRYDEDQKQFAHPAALTFLKPNGRVARYLYGIQVEPADMKLALIEASEGKSVSTVEQLLMRCYTYDPQAAKYVVAAQRIMQAGGAVTVVLLASVLAILWRRDLRRQRAQARSSVLVEVTR